MNHQNLHLLNQAYVVLISKDTPQKINDYMPISLTHSFVKIVSKLMANRLGSELQHMVSHNQTTFIKKCIHDKFMFV
jgi:hypothetical protein